MGYRNKHCLICGKEFIPLSSKSSYCSKECLQINTGERIKKDKEMNPQKYIERKKRYNENRKKKKLKDGKRVLSYCIVKCDVCEKEFVPNAPSKKYCSRQCRNVVLNRQKIELRNKDRYKARNIDKKCYRKKVGYEPIKKIACEICGDLFIRRGIRSKRCEKEECEIESIRKKALCSYYKNYDRKKEQRQRRYEYRKINDKEYYLILMLRERLRSALNTKNIRKRFSAVELIGCSIDYFKKYLESKFDKDMTWDNYGFYGWHIDHIKPCSKFDLTNEEEQKKCFHYNNLQPLWMKDNFRKGARYNE